MSFLWTQINKGHSLTYLLSVHWMGCFYWNKVVKEWSTEGCRMIDLNTPQMFHCRLAFFCLNPLYSDVDIHILHRA